MITTPEVEHDLIELRPDELAHCTPQMIVFWICSNPEERRLGLVKFLSQNIQYKDPIVAPEKYVAESERLGMEIEGLYDILEDYQDLVPSARGTIIDVIYAKLSLKEKYKVGTAVGETRSKVAAI